jgi:hypothetical protein
MAWTLGVAAAKAEAADKDVVARSSAPAIGANFFMISPIAATANAVTTYPTHRPFANSSHYRLILK